MKELSKKKKTTNFLIWHIFSMLAFFGCLIVGLSEGFGLLPSFGLAVLLVTISFPIEAFWRWYFNIKPKYKIYPHPEWSAIECEYGHSFAEKKS